MSKWKEKVRCCPFCGKMPNVLTNTVDNETVSYSFRCCAVQFGAFRTMRILKDRWNERFCV